MDTDTTVGVIKTIERMLVSLYAIKTELAALAGSCERLENGVIARIAAMEDVLRQIETPETKKLSREESVAHLRELIQLHKEAGLNPEEFLDYDDFVATLPTN